MGFQWISTTYRSTGGCDRISGSPVISAPQNPNTPAPQPGGGEALPPAFLGFGGSKIQSSFPPGEQTNHPKKAARMWEVLMNIPNIPQVGFLVSKSYET